MRNSLFVCLPCYEYNARSVLLQRIDKFCCDLNKFQLINKNVKGAP